MKRYCMDLKETCRAGFSLVGGKAAALGELISAGFNVPVGFCVTTTCCEEFIRFNHLRKELEKLLSHADPGNPSALIALSERIRSLIEAGEFPQRQKESIKDFYTGRMHSAIVAVRSSAKDEDSREFSFAGQMDTFLSVKGADELLKHIKKCWSSLWTPRAIAYRCNKNLEKTGAIGVIVQKMAAAESSGVMFTADPLGSEEDCIVIESGWGLGQGIVSGIVIPDHFVLDRKDLSIRKIVISEKTVRFDGNNSGNGTSKAEVGEEKRNVQSLGQSELREIGGIGLQIEKLFDDPQDIEWCYADKRFYILQARPITRHLEEKAPVIWSNANIAENFPGVITPFTMSVVDFFYIHYFRGLFEALGVGKTYYKEYESVLENMIGIHNGRLYLNMNNWYEMLASIPYYSYTKGFLDAFIGIGDEIDYRPKMKGFSFFGKGLKRKPDMIRFWITIAADYIFLDRKIRRFETGFRAKEDQWRSRDYRNRDLVQLGNDIEDVMSVFEDWRDAGLADTAALIFYGVLRELTGRWAGDTGHTVHNSLLKALKGLKSAEPAKEIWRLSRTVSCSSDLSALILETDPSEVYSTLKGMDSADARNFLDEMDGFLLRYGARHAEELKMSSPSLSEKPDFIFSMIRSYLASDNLNPLESEEREREDRMRITGSIIRKIPAGPVSWFVPVSRKAVFRWVLKNAQRSIMYRERVRFCQAVAFGELRRIALATGAKLTQRGEIEEAEDIFFLKTDEICNYIMGKLIFPSSVKSIISSRKLEAERDEKNPPPDTLVLNKGEYLNRSRGQAGSMRGPEQERTDGVLRGIGSCNGKVTARAKVILDPMKSAGLKPGEILVTRLTDPGWAPLFLTAGGLVLDRGGMLSHGSIIAREFGIPAVVGVRTGTDDIRDGQLITVDGDLGLVYLHPEKEAAA